MDALTQVNAAVEPIQPLAPTIGDECQGIFGDVPSALLAALLLRLMLPDPHDCRVGIGVGSYETVGESNFGPMQDGPAWWAARDAIVEAKSREGRKHKSLRSWYVVGEGAIRAPEPSAINAFLLCRDQIVSGMNDRSRRLLLGLLQGRTQVELAKREDITQSTVSQNLQRSGAYAVLGAADMFGEVARS